MKQDVTDNNTEYLSIFKSLTGRSVDKSRQVVAQLIAPQSKKCVIFGVRFCKKKLAPPLSKASSRVAHEMLKIHNKQNWLKRCGITLLDNGAGLAMAMLSTKIVQAHVEVKQFGNLWGLLATRPVVSESTYEVLNFSVEFFIAVIVFTITDHYLTEFRQRKDDAEEPADGSGE